MTAVTAETVLSEDRTIIRNVRAPKAARTFIRWQLLAWGVSDVIETVELVASSLSLTPCSRRELDVEGVFVQIGLLPNTEWLDGTIELTGRKEIVTHERGATSIPGVFAAGDATTTAYKQIVTALGGGSTAALSAFDYLIRTTVEEAAGEEEAVA
jgi:alkyl hydroperoxide reductase subunit AhpF